MLCSPVSLVVGLESELRKMFLSCAKIHSVVGFPAQSSVLRVILRVYVRLLFPTPCLTPAALYLRAGSGTVQLVTGWEKICSRSTRPRSPARTTELPWSPSPTGVCVETNASFLSDASLNLPRILSKVRTSLRQQPGVWSIWRFLLDRSQ